jgi:uncharacterized membrane protein
LSRRLSFIGGLASLLLILFPTVAFFASDPAPAPAPAGLLPKGARKRPRAETPAGATAHSASSFVLLLIILGSLLVIAPEFVFLRDQFGSRLNTIFKFYYQAWLLWSLAAGFGVAILLKNLRGAADWLFRSALLFVLIVSLTYPVLALSNKTNGFNPPGGWTLDDFTRIERSNPDEAAAILWLKAAPDGVLAEAIGGSYSGYARISEYTGLAAVLGWPGHESQWRGTRDPQGTREDDVALLYSTPNWETALAILKKYDIRYLYVGGLERSTYSVQETKFQHNMSQVFQRGNVTIYQTP